ncbi:MAG TPA: SHOCT domain-containing protein [Pseudolabrys sp.]|nr:SHOCT domain-containing protein [Pseudolabrys sp.]
MWGYGPGSGYGMMGGGFGYGWGYGILHLAVTVAIIVGVVYFVLWALRAMSGTGHHHPLMAPPAGPGRSSGLDILEERYAKGEINRDEYLEKKGDIGG